VSEAPTPQPQAPKPKPQTLTLKNPNSSFSKQLGQAVATYGASHSSDTRLLAEAEARLRAEQVLRDGLERLVSV